MSHVVSPAIDVEALRAAMEGEVVGPGDAAYDEARKIWNGMLDRYPAAVARCASTSDVVAAVNFARERAFGFTCENLIAAEVVTAAGQVVTASAEENPDLLWGLKGGGGNFGVVTEFVFRLHPVGPIVVGGMLLYPRAEARNVIRAYRDYMVDAPDEVGGGVALLTAPPEPFVPADLQGQPAVAIVYCYAGDVERGLEAAAPLRAIGTPALDLIQPMPYVALQSMLDGGMPPGIREYFKVDYLSALN